MVAYLAKFLPNLSEVTGPLRELLKDDTEWYWGSAQETSFANLKQLLANTSVLAFYSPEAPTIVSADASSYTGWEQCCCKNNKTEGVHPLPMLPALSTILKKDMPR